MIDNKMVIDQINLKEHLQSMSFPSVRAIRQEEYDLIQTPDLNTFYIIINAKDGRIYHGTMLIIPEKQKTMYLLGPSDEHGEYIIYLNQMIEGQTHLIQISRFNDSELAIKTLNRLNRIGGHSDWALQTYNLFLAYIQKEISIHDLIIGIISLFGYRDDPRLQEVIQMANLGRAHHSNRDLPISLREDLITWKNAKHNHLLPFYSNLYDLIVLYDFFKAREYQIELPDLEEVITRVFNIILNLDL